MSLDIGVLSGRVELDDKLTPVLDLSTVSVEQFERMFSRMGSTVTQQATAFFTAEVAIRAVEGAIRSALGIVTDFTTRGAMIGDVAESFERLTEGAGRMGDTLLGKLRTGTHGTIDDLRLMQMVNQDLAAGLNLTDDQFKQMADGAFALAQATGQDVAQALETVNQALLTGRTRSLQQLTGRIDLEAAEKKYAETLGTTVDHLTNEGKLHAARLGILEAVGKATAKLGEQTDGVDEIIAQIQTTWTNFYNDLLKAVATSPNVVKAFTAIRDALFSAFGDTASVQEKILEWVNAFADQVAYYGPKVIQWFRDAWQWVTNLAKTVVQEWNTLPDWFKEVAKWSVAAGVGVVAAGGALQVAGNTIEGLIGVAGNLGTALTSWPKIWQGITGAVGSAAGVLKTLDFSSLADARASVALLAEGAMAAIGPLGALAVAIGAVVAAYKIGQTEAVSGFFENLGLRLQGFSAEEARAAIESRKLNEELLKQADAAHKTAQAAQAAEAAAAAAAKEAEAKRVAAVETKNLQVMEQARAHILAKTEAESKKLAAAQAELKSSGDSWKLTVQAMDQTQVAAIKGYLEAGVAQGTLATAYGVTATQITAVAKALDAEQEAMKLEAKAQQDSLARWNEYHALREARSGVATDMTMLHIRQWERQQIESHIKAKTATADFYTWVGQMSREMYQQENQRRLEADVNSKAYWQKLARDAQEAYDFAARNSSEFTQTHIQNLKMQADAAAQTAAMWRAGLGGALDSVSAKATEISGKMSGLAGQAKEIMQSFSTTADPISEYDVERQGGPKKLLEDLRALENLLPTAQANVKDFKSWDTYLQMQLRYNLLKQAYPMLLQMLKKDSPGFAGGGYGDFGSGTLAVLHGKEAIVPMEGGGSGSMGEFFASRVPKQSVVFNVSVNGDGRTVAREMMQKIKMSRQFWSA